MSDPNSDFRSHLLGLHQQAEASYDRTLLTLSGGALGLSLTFIKHIVGEPPVRTPLALVIAWVAWALSLAVVLASHYMSARALHYALKQLPSSGTPTSRLGGRLDMITQGLNIAGGALFLTGPASFIVFVLGSVVGANGR